jgi:hypothetical protein
MSITRFHAMRRTSMSSVVAMVDVVVDRRGQKVVRERDRIEVAGEVEIDVFHRHDLGIAAARPRPPFMPIHGPREGSRRQITAFLPI